MQNIKWTGPGKKARNQSIPGNVELINGIIIYGSPLFQNGLYLRPPKK